MENMDKTLASRALDASGSASISICVKERRQNLHSMRKFRIEPGKFQSALNAMSLDDVRKYEREIFPPPCSASRIRTLGDEELTDQAIRAREWLLGILECHDAILHREHEVRMFRSAVEKAMNGQENSWSDMERLYMMLTDPALSSPEIRLRSTFFLVLHLNYAERLQDMGNLAAVRLERIQHAKQSDRDLPKTHERIREMLESMKIDHFVCAVPLSALKQTSATSIVDDNAGCCPICQNSYTDLSAFKIEDLLADYPVRLKQCGHIVGRGCLEQWMVTPKIDEAKYPHRTCPLCRTKIEGTELPRKPRMLQRHVGTNFRARTTMLTLMCEYGIEPEEGLDAIVASISTSIACDELLAEVHRQRGNGDMARSHENERILQERRAAVRQEIRAWGFRGTAAWKAICAAWTENWGGGKF